MVRKEVVSISNEVSLSPEKPEKKKREESPFYQTQGKSDPTTRPMPESRFLLL